MSHLGQALASEGIETACISLRRSRPWDDHHAENARDMIASREAFGWEEVSYSGFSAGGLSALFATSQDPACGNVVLLDPVDHGKPSLEAVLKSALPRSPP